MKLARLGSFNAAKYRLWWCWVVAALAAFQTIADAQQVWTNLWAMPTGMNAIDAELATDGDNSTQMRVFGPIRQGALVAIDMRSAVKVTHVVSAAPSSSSWWFHIFGAPWSLPRAAGRRRSA